jgi:hypothetical protein
MEETAPTNIFSTFCHRLTYKFAQDPFFNKGQRAKCVLQPAQNGRHTTIQQNDSSSFAELGSLVRMIDHCEQVWSESMITVF